MRALRIEIRAPVVSFRHPHFLIGRQPTYEMPPPSTIYGFIASVLGELPAPDGLQFAYRFTFQARASDYEHQHIITAARPRQSFSVGQTRFPFSVNVEIQPHARDFLFQARLVLYLNALELAEAFRQPVFPVILGRSQDLAEITEVREVSLETRAGAYLEHTLLPFSLRPRLTLGYTVWMPRYIGPPPHRQPIFDRFVLLRERVYAGQVERAEDLGIRRLLKLDGHAESWLVDPETPVDRGVCRGIIFHSFVG